jgi:hypothetical protein
MGAFAQIQAAFTQHPEILNFAFTAADREGLRLDLRWNTPANKFFEDQPAELGGT